MGKLGYKGNIRKTRTKRKIDKTGYTEIVANIGKIRNIVIK